MALDLGDLNAFFDASMTATVAGAMYPEGKKYTIPPVSGELGLWGRSVAALRGQVEAAATPEERAAALRQAETEIGPPPIPPGQTMDQAMLSVKLHAELLADGVADEMIQHMARIVYARIIGGDQLAVAYARGDSPNPNGPVNRAERRAAEKAAKKTVKATPKKASGSRTTSTAAAATTLRAGSGSGTTSLRKSSGTAQAAASSRGRRS